MIHRAEVERDGALGTDSWGNPNEPDWATHITSLPCRTWFDSEREVFDGNKSAAIENRKVIVPLGTDITEDDRIAQVTDRLGSVLFTGPAKIESLGRRADHLVLMLEEVH